ncbi:MAG: 2-oxo acid dehydrogenase subunit E2 [Armatimonadetes bacterium]|nr:2-oxo acid dehydrogenase subunit E2 [Armatimonadota bacterium]
MPPLTMPKMGDAMEVGTILKWLKKEGESFQEQEAIAEIQTEKSTIEVPAYEAGRLVKILVPEGETVPVGAPIAEVEPAREERRRARAAPPEAPRPAAPPVEAPPVAATTAVARAVPPPEGRLPPPSPERVKASPLARKLAAERGLDLARIRGTGPGGRIVEADVLAALAAPAPAPPAAPPAPPGIAAPPIPARERPMSPVRRVVARRIAESKRTIPHFYLTLDVDAAPLTTFRQQYNAAVAEADRVSFNDLVVKACAIALPRFPQLNSQLVGEDTIRTFEGVHIGIAVALPEGLVVPVVRDCQAKTLRQISREARQLAERARAGALTPTEYSGGTFTISNLGMYGITLFQAVINPPEAAILAVGAIRDEAVVRDGQVVPGRRMSLTISVDHRLVDGARAAEFLQEVKRLLETPMALVE